MTHSLDITREHCPMTFVKVKLELSRLEAGELLDVALTGEEPLVNVPRSAEEQGHRIVSISEAEGIHHLVIQKAGVSA